MSELNFVDLWMRSSFFKTPMVAEKTRTQKLLALYLLFDVSEADILRKILLWI